MSDELITVDNVSKDLLKSLFDAAFMEVTFDKDGDLLVTDRVKCFVLISKDLRRIQLMTLFGFKPEATNLQRYECVNKINKDYVMVRAVVGANDTLFFTYDLLLDGGISKRAFVLQVKRFCSIPHTAVSDYGADIVK